MYLYGLKNKLGFWYVIADDPTEAQKIVENALNEEDYGFPDERKTTDIQIIAKEIKPALNDKHFFCGGATLFLDKFTNVGGQ